MHAFISDLHMDDTGASGSVSDADLVQFLLYLERLSVENTKKITLVFIGDVFELLRSPRWEVLWKKHNSAALGAGCARTFAILETEMLKNA